MSFYNTYRPQTFNDLHSAKVRATLQSFLTKDKSALPHAFILSGPRGIGKTTTARLIAKYFNCVSPLKTGEPCGTCEMCTRIAKGSAMDILEIDGASNTGVDNIRDIKDKIMLSPSSAQYKVYIIDEVHMLSTGAFNALLKTLEEPPANTIFILATTDIHKVPETIQSRCLILTFQKPEIEEVTTALRAIAIKEKITVEDSVLTTLSKQADGSFRDAVKLLEQASMVSRTIDTETIVSLLQLPEEKTVMELIELIRTKNIASIIRIIDSIQTNGSDMRELYKALIGQLQQRLVLSVTQGSPDTWDTSELQHLLTLLLEYFAGTRNHGMSTLSLELALVAFCNSNPQTQAKPTSTSTSTSTTTPTPVAPLPNTPIVKPAPTAVSQTPKIVEKIKDSPPPEKLISPTPDSGSLTRQTLETHWTDIVKSIQGTNHSLAGVLRSTRPKSVENGIVTIETSYTFHKDKLSEALSLASIAKTIKTLFGENVTIEIVLSKK